MAIGLAVHGGVVALTGVVLIFLRYAFFDPDPFIAYPHQFWPWLIGAHILAIPGLFFLVGSIWHKHIRLQWNRRRRRLSGVQLVAFILATTVTGYLLYFVGAERPLQITRLVHAGVGMGLILVAGHHSLAGLRFLVGPGRRSRQGIDFRAKK